MSTQSQPLTARPLVSREEWTEARKVLLADEKALTRQHDEIAARRRELPWVLVEKDYVFASPDGPVSLADLFEGRSQLAVYHFMFGPDWTQGCHRCSFWADNFDGTDIHLAHRDTTFLAISNTSIANIEAYRQRMGWDFRWVSSLDTDFNPDYGVSWDKKTYESGTGSYNFGAHPPFFQEMQGLSIFVKLEDGRVAHAYSTYGRGIDVFNGAYQILDLTPKGRDEQDLGFDPMVWIQRHDQYKD